MNYTNAFTAQLFYLRREQGRLAEIEPVLADAVAANPGIVGFRVALAATYADLGRPADARMHFDVAATDEFAGVPRDLAWTGALTLLADVCAGLGDVEQAPVLADLLAPYAGQLVVAATGVACPGARRPATAACWPSRCASPTRPAVASKLPSTSNGGSMRRCSWPEPRRCCPLAGEDVGERGAAVERELDGGEAGQRAHHVAVAAERADGDDVVAGPLRTPAAGRR